MNILGQIISELSFTLEPEESRRYNLRDNQDLQPRGRGVSIGQWSLSIDNPPAGVSVYEVTYEFEPLKAPRISDVIDFVLLESDEQSATAVLRSSGSSSRLEVTGTDNTVTRSLRARLTEEGALSVQQAAASDAYRSDIIISLVQE
ncbi:MAG: hypothetical protein JXK93_00785 [Sphaerochaetaceae bacterium]|nr:hypothetical protein [Sphaerochaetaceae bacterium]